ERLGLADADRGGAAVEAADHAGDQVALLGVVLVEDGGGLLLLEQLDDHLLGGLGGDAAQRLDVQRLFTAAGGDLAAVAVDGDVDVGFVFVVVVLVDGEADRLFDGGEDDLARDVLLAVDVVHTPQQLGAVDHDRSSDAAGRGRPGGR